MIARQKILSYLKKSRAASAREIARALKMSAPNVRHHLAVLTSDGRAEQVSETRREGKGRPQKMYAIPQAALGDNLPALIQALLAESNSMVSMDALANRLVDPKQFENLPIPKRLPLLIEVLNRMHHSPKWEAGPEGPRVLLGRCPYWQVIHDHPELCRMDTTIIEKSLGRPVDASAKNDSPIRASCPFIFQIR